MRKRFKRVIRYFINSIYYLFYNNPIIISAWVDVHKGKIIHRNWGDELNIYIIELLTQRKVIIENESFLHKIFPPKQKFICIGSIIGWHETPNAEIWGTGAMSKSVIISIKPKIIHSVRGKLTRDLLLSQNLDVPQCYGDPALLLSKIYLPQITPIYKLGIIPHYVELEIPFIKQFCAEHNDVILIDLKNYERWTDIIDLINSCKYIISSSLHGLITSDSYNIPNQWVSFSHKWEEDKNFKYYDYFSSVKRNNESCKLIYNKEDLEIYYNSNIFHHYCNPVIDFKSIIQSCPFTINNPLLKSYLL